MASPGSSISLPPRNDTFLKAFFKHQLMPNPKPPLESLSVAGKTAVITALLALLLLPALKNTTQPSTPGRLTLVASGAALIAEFSERNAIPLLPSFDKAEGWNASTAKKRYDTTKGLVLMLVYKLSTITKAENTVINVVDPTFTPGTGFFRNLPFLMKLFAWPVAILLGTSVNKAAWTYIYAAVARGTESHGSFLSDWKSILRPPSSSF
ncbi:hypothetical protein BP5796_08846 [Coleophoma crateriformis]|uniref:Uncharacterized protein n=1 Tax=Coleophoma crateriformis TaxID=565419 RepID=A0A3D8R2D1_9HELO|nr:hypothetical protein BP5796_08846 [Coleophoma crateriformis]